MRKFWAFLTNRVILGMLLFLVLMGAWEFRVKSELFPHQLMEDPER